MPSACFHSKPTRCVRTSAVVTVKALATFRRNIGIEIAEGKHSGQHSSTYQVASCGKGTNTLQKDLSEVQDTKQCLKGTKINYNAKWGVERQSLKSKTLWKTRCNEQKREKNLRRAVQQKCQVQLQEENRKTWASRTKHRHNENGKNYEKTPKHRRQKTRQPAVRYGISKTTCIPKSPKSQESSKTVLERIQKLVRERDRDHKRISIRTDRELLQQCHVQRRPSNDKMRHFALDPNAIQWVQRQITLMKKNHKRERESVTKNVSRPKWKKKTTRQTWQYQDNHDTKRHWTNSGKHHWRQPHSKQQIVEVQRSDQEISSLRVN